MTKTTALLGSLFLSLLVARTASAAVCAEIDPTRDNLTDQDRAALLTLLAQSLQQQGQEVTNQNCMGTYRVYHVRLGTSVTVFMEGPQGYRQAQARALEEVPAVYSQMIRSLLTGQPMNTSNGTVDRTNVTSGQQAPNRVEADSLWYARLGYAAAIGPLFNSGPAIGFGYRYELDNIGIDLSFFNLMFASNQGDTSGTNTSVGVTGSWIKLMGLYFMNPTANASLYFGGGVSWGGVAVADAGNANDTTDDKVYSGSGLQGEFSAGYELLRASTIRLFIQADATLPIYTVTQDYPGTGSKAYVPTFGVSFGLGWGRSIHRVHIVP